MSILDPLEREILSSKQPPMLTQQRQSDSPTIAPLLSAAPLGSERSLRQKLAMLALGILARPSDEVRRRATSATLRPLSQIGDLNRSPSAALCSPSENPLKRVPAARLPRACLRRVS